MVYLNLVQNQAEDQTEENSDEEEAPEITKWESVIWLSILTAWISVLSEYLVNAIEVTCLVKSVISSSDFG